MAEPRVGDVVLSSDGMEPFRVDRVRLERAYGHSLAGLGTRKRTFRLRNLEKVDEGMYQEVDRG